MFQSARIKLTLWYLFIIICISGALSTLAYIRVISVLDMEFNRIQRRMEMENEGFMPRHERIPQFNRPRILPEDIISAKKQILLQLIFVNGVIIIIFSTLGYLLTGKTLSPLKKAMEEQKRFIGDAAHELKTPLTSLKTALEVNLMDKKLNQTTKKLLQNNLLDLIDLETLADRLLQLARLDQMTLPLSMHQVMPIIDKAIRHIQPLADKKNISINKKNKLVENQLVYTEISSLKELLIIILDNAVKYSGLQTAIEISILKTGKLVSISISDQGIGIPEKEQSNIFKRFYRVDQSRSKSITKGYGLGLALANQIAEQIHGKIVCQSRVGQGSTFTIILPCEKI